MPSGSFFICTSLSTRTRRRPSPNRRSKRMSKLLVKADKGHGRVAHVTPKSAGWTYVGFDLHRLQPGESASGRTEDREVCLVFVTGKGTAKAGGKDLGLL